MLPSAAQQTADLRMSIGHCPTAVTFGTQVVNCLKTVIEAAEITAAAGELAGYRFSLYAILADWSPLPVDGELLTIGGTQYRIARSHEDDVGIRWDMADKYRSQAP